MIIRALRAHLVVTVRLEDVEDRLDVLEVVHASTCRCGGVQVDCGDGYAGRGPNLLCPPLRRSSRPETYLGSTRYMSHVMSPTRTMTMLSTLFCLFSEAIVCTQVLRLCKSQR